MVCRIGITTNVEKRRQVWKSECFGFNSWKILDGPFSNREHAQRRETELANKYNCIAHGGGSKPNNPNAKWYVYRFNYIRKR